MGLNAYSLSPRPVVLELDCISEPPGSILNIQKLGPTLSVSGSVGLQLRLRICFLTSSQVRLTSLSLQALYVENHCLII